MKVRIYTLGCKVNQFESQAMLRMLGQSGYTPVSGNEAADITIINSCAVTAASEAKAIRLMHRIRRENPETIIVLTGCMAQSETRTASQLAEADIIIGNKKRGDIIPVLEKYISTRKKITDISPYSSRDEYEPLIVDDFSEHTRAFLKIEDGCNRFCSYCIIPYARGRVRSSSLTYIKKEIEGFASNGYKEVVLVGINLSCYGSDLGTDFSDAVATACEASGMRIRLGSLEPESISMETLRRLAEYDNFCPQFHLSLQSGCAATLRRMNRHYTPQDYMQIVMNIRSVFDNAAITTDVIVGFPGETEEEFIESMRFVEAVGFARVHIFPYSRRPGTAADKASDQVPEDIKKRRASRMSEAAGKAAAQFMQSQVGRTERVLLETRSKNGMFEGYTPNYTLVYVKADEKFTGSVVDVKLTSAGGDCCYGDILQP